MSIVFFVLGVVSIVFAVPDYMARGFPWYWLISEPGVSSGIAFIAAGMVIFQAYRIAELRVKLAEAEE